MEPKLLVIGNNPLTKTNANGRTLLGLLHGWPRERVAQFYIKPGRPDPESCGAYYRLTDRDVIRSVFLPKDGVTERTEASHSTAPAAGGGQSKPKKTVLFEILRNCCWTVGHWKTKALRQWIRGVSPECVVLQVGDSTFLIKFACRLVKKLGVPLIVFNSESYYFKRENYLGGGAGSNLLYRLFCRNYRKWFDRMMAAARYVIYLNDSLKELYAPVFSTPAAVIRNAAQLSPRDEEPEERRGFSYLGNLGIKRYESLVELADALRGIDESYYLDVYGKISDKACEAAFAACPAIRYQGFVDYSTVERVMRTSRLVFHAESFRPEIVKEIQYAFSTKIPDALACGTCFVYYGDASIDGARYLREHDCACVITDPGELKTRLEALLADPELRKRYTENAKKLVRQEHDLVKNSERFQGIVYESLAD